MRKIHIQKRSITSKKGLTVAGLFAVAGVVLLTFTLASPKDGQLIAPGIQHNRSTDSAVVALRHQVQDSTDELTVFAKAAKGNPKDSVKANKRIVELSQERFNDIRTLLEKDPASAEDLLLPESIRASVASVAGTAVEQPITVTGRYASSDEHGVKADGTHVYDREHNFLYVAGAAWSDTQRYDMYSGDSETWDELPIDSVLNASGAGFGDKILLQTLRPADPGAAATKNRLQQWATAIGKALASPKAEAITTGTIPTAVIAVSCSDSPQPFNMTNLRNVIQDTPAHNVVDYYKETSYGKAVLAPSFFGPYTLSNFSSAAGQCYDSQAFEQAVYQIANADINFLNYKRIFIALNDQNKDGTGSGSGLGGPEHLINTPDGTITAAQAFVGNAWGFLGISTHEMGHAFGPGHAQYYNCLPNAFDPPTRYGLNCAMDTYGDSFDVMGRKGISDNYIAGQFSAAHKDLTGWFNAANKITLSTPGTFTHTLTPLETPSAGPQAIFIQRGNSGTGFWLDYRQALGYDSWLASAASCSGCVMTNGPEIHFMEKGDIQPQLVDTTPYSRAGLDQWDSALASGKTFSDPEYGIKVTTNSSSTSGTSVTVVIPDSVSCTRGAPNVTASNATQTIAPGQTATYNLSITNTDSSTCSPNLFHVDVPSGTEMRMIATPSSMTLAPGATTTATVTITWPIGNRVTNTSQPYQMYVSGNYPSAAGKGVVLTANLTSPADTTVPSAPTAVTAQAAGSKQVNLAWTGSSDNIGISGYEIYRDGVSIGTKPAATGPSFMDTAVTPGTSYSYTVAGFDYANNHSAKSGAVSVATLTATDTSSPTAPTNVQFSFQDAHTLTVSWTPGTDNVGVTRYAISGAGESIIAPAGATSATLSGLAADRENTYYIYAYDGAGNSNYANITETVAFTPREGTLPPARPSITSHVTVTANRVDTFFSASSGASKYTYFRDGRPVGSAAYPAISDSRYPSDGFAHYDFVQAADNNGNINQSPGSVGPGMISPVSTDVTNPTAQITGPAAGTTLSTMAAISVAASDNIKISGIELYVDNQLVAANTGTWVGGANGYAANYSGSLSFDTKQFSNGTHSLVAKAYDGTASNVGPSVPVSINIGNAVAPDTTPPAVAITNPVAGSTVSNTVTTTATASDNIGVSRVDFNINGTPVGSDDTAPYTNSFNSALLQNGTHSLGARAYDAAGNSTPTSIIVTISNGDTTKPSTPTGLSAAASAYNRINLSWTASTDNVAVAGYYIVRGGVTIAQTTGTSTVYTDTTVSASTAYNYQVIAYDAAGNISAASGTASATTPNLSDIQAPTTPTNVAAAAVSSSQINLTWTASTDNVGVTSYVIYRDGSTTPRATVAAPGTSFGDTGLAASSTHSYTVVAKDAAGNASAVSSTAIATTKPAVTTGTLIGIVSSSAGGPVSGASVSLTFNGSKHTYTTTSTGSYTVPNLPAATYSVKYAASHHASQTVNIPITAGQTYTRNITLQKR